MSRRTYAVSWNEESGENFVGKLELGVNYVRLEGRAANGRELLRAFHAGDIAGIATERRNGHREIVLSGHSRRIAVNVIDGAGSFGELLDELQSRAEKPHDESGVAPMSRAT